MMFKARLLALLAVSCLLLATSASAQVVGWQRIEPNDSTSYDLFVPEGVDISLSTPIILFLHGAGSSPSNVRPQVQSAAQDTKSVLVVPAASNSIGGWSFNDVNILADSLDDVRTLINVNENRIGVAGHSSGGAFAYSLAYGGSTPFSAVFTMGAPFYDVPSLGSGDYVPPIRMYYGKDDPNYASALGPLRDQWARLEVPFEVEEREDADHTDLPYDSIKAGFEFLKAQSRGEEVTSFGCESTEESLCLSGGRFRVTVDWQAANEEGGAGQVASLRSDGSGLFWFFNPNNWELLVKVLNGCGVNNHFWVFSAATTAVEYTLSVEDLATGDVALYYNPLNSVAPAVTDTEALATCDATVESAFGGTPSL